MTATALRAGTDPGPDIRRELVIFALVAVSFPMVAAMEPGSPAAAVERAEAIARFQAQIGLDPAPVVDRVIGSGLGRLVADTVYYTAHVPAIVAVFAWLGARHPGGYVRIRRIFVLAHLLTIASYLALPTAPPRLVPSLGGIDPDAAGSTWHTLQYEFAAFPSGHVVFATIVGVALFRHGGAVLSAIGVGYPVAVIAVTLATDNHFVADAIGGLLVVGVAVEATRVWAHLESARLRHAPSRRTVRRWWLISNDS